MKKQSGDEAGVGLEGCVCEDGVSGKRGLGSEEESEIREGSRSPERGVGSEAKFAVRAWDQRQDRGSRPRLRSVDGSVG